MKRVLNLFGWCEWWECSAYGMGFRVMNQLFQTEEEAEKFKQELDGPVIRQSPFTLQVDKVWRWSWHAPSPINHRLFLN